ncbi:hypothetical protein OG552_14720 [Streptomyces sp. NBC_01476]|uniref:YhfZ family protein n=1 Tax=Streptomyces sp. NBC_01476 TaxID=2903881 RepID=UPI002E32BD1A|nr:YhfZ family protein [Streptomyces sp. NBC_01476]
MLEQDRSPAPPAAAPARRPLEQALQAIVVDALGAGVGATLPTNSHYLRAVGASAGTVQRAIKVLAEQGALTTTSRGHLGRTIDSLRLGPAWHIAGLSPLRLLLPPSGPAEIDVLTESLAGELTRLGVPHTVHHRRGGARRLDAVAIGAYDLAIVSAGALDGADVPSLDGAPTLRLPPGTYYAPRRLVVVSRTGEAPAGPGMRVAIDHDSPDHTLLTKAAFPPDRGYTYVQHTFPEVPAAVLRREVDAGIWHLSHTVIPLDLAGLQCTAMEDLDVGGAWRDLSAAVVIGWPQRGELTSVLASIRLPELVEAQHRRLADEAP